MLNKLKLEDVPDAYKDLAEEIGFEAFKKLIDFTGGGVIYIPQLSAINACVRNREIRENFNGNIKELSKKYCLSEMQIRRIVKEEKIK